MRRERLRTMSEKCERTEWPGWATDGGSFSVQDGVNKPNFLRWFLDRRGRVWGYDGAMSAWCRGGISDGVPLDSVRASGAVGFTEIRVEPTVTVDLTDVHIGKQSVAVRAGARLFDVRRVLTLGVWFPDAAWGAVEWNEHVALVRCDHEGAVLGAVMEFVP